MKVSYIALSGVIGMFCAMPSFGAGISICDAVPGNLVANCGFETGDLTNWTVTPAASGSSLGPDSSNPNSGSFDAYFGAFDGLDDFLDQSLATNAGDLYNISFFVDASSVGASPDEFEANWDGTTNLLTLPGPVGTGYQQYSFTEVASSTSTDLQFGGNSPPSFYFLDDVVVTDAGPSGPTPEPASIAFTVVGVFGIWLMRRRYSTKPV